MHVWRAAYLFLVIFGSVVCLFCLHGAQHAYQLGDLRETQSIETGLESPYQS